MTRKYTNSCDNIVTIATHTEVLLQVEVWRPSGPAYRAPSGRKAHSSSASSCALLLSLRGLLPVGVERFLYLHLSNRGSGVLCASCFVLLFYVDAAVTFTTKTQSSVYFDCFETIRFVLILKALRINFNSLDFIYRYCLF